MSRHHSIGEIAEQLVISRGNMAEASRKLDMTRAAVKKRVDSSEDLQHIVTSIKETVLDTAEEMLLVLALEIKDFQALKFLLNSKGRGRGYGKQVIEQTNKDGNPDPLQPYRDMTPEQRQKKLAELRERQGAV